MLIELSYTNDMDAISKGYKTNSILFLLFKGHTLLTYNINIWVFVWNY